MKFMPANLTQTVSRNAFTVKANSPHLFFGAGLVGMAVSTVLACRATLKLEATLDEIQKDLDNIKVMRTQVDDKGRNTYSLKQYQQDLLYVYTKATVKLGKLYAPAVIFGVVSTGLLAGSHVQLTRRNAALLGAYAALNEAYEHYRQRVREEIGDEKEREIYYDIRSKQLESGELVTTVDPTKHSIYARFFDEYSIHWEKDPELNKLFVQCQQNFANQLLLTKGHLFLNEVYDMLGIERSGAGQVVGWLVGNGDSYVDFHIFDGFHNAFVNGHERSVLLDFNVDGVIYDKI